MGCLFFYITFDQANNVSVSAAAHNPEDNVHFFWSNGKENVMCTTLPSGLPCPPPQATSSALFNDPGTVNGVLFLMWDPASSVSGELFVDIISGGQPCGGLECCDCLPSFLPSPGSSYIISGWCKLENASSTLSSYASVNGPFIDVVTSLSPIPVITISPDGPIIDGWQRMEGTFELPQAAQDLTLLLRCDECRALFDDVRYFPADASMKCSVYDPVTLRLDAELDERHFATFYEYDGEGKLVRIKKETERGIMTIQETRYNSAKTP
ncbi:MAG: hypothetical protein JNM91_08235 [Flavobacteriales bacterium]|nr:hypothetical protein [Flavobacteriales bacterium]